MLQVHLSYFRCLSRDDILVGALILLEECILDQTKVYQALEGCNCKKPTVQLCQVKSM